MGRGTNTILLLVKGILLQLENALYAVLQIEPEQDTGQQSETCECDMRTRYETRRRNLLLVEKEKCGDGVACWHCGRTHGRTNEAYQEGGYN